MWEWKLNRKQVGMVWKRNEIAILNESSKPKHLIGTFYSHVSMNRIFVDYHKLIKDDCFLCGIPTHWEQNGQACFCTMCPKWKAAISYCLLVPTTTHGTFILPLICPVEHVVQGGCSFEWSLDLNREVRQAEGLGPCLLAKEALEIEIAKAIIHSHIHVRLITHKHFGDVLFEVE